MEKWDRSKVVELLVRLPQLLKNLRDINQFSASVAELVTWCSYEEIYHSLLQAELISCLAVVRDMIVHNYMQVDVAAGHRLLLECYTNRDKLLTQNAHKVEMIYADVRMWMSWLQDHSPRRRRQRRFLAQSAAEIFGAGAVQGMAAAGANQPIAAAATAGGSGQELPVNTTVRTEDSVQQGMGSAGMVARGGQAIYRHGTNSPAGNQSNTLAQQADDKTEKQESAWFSSPLPNHATISVPYYHPGHGGTLNTAGAVGMGNPRDPTVVMSNSTTRRAAGNFHRRRKMPRVQQSSGSLDYLMQQAESSDGAEDEEDNRMSHQTGIQSLDYPSAAMSHQPGIMSQQPGMRSTQSELFSAPNVMAQPLGTMSHATGMQMLDHPPEVMSHQPGMPPSQPKPAPHRISARARELQDRRKSQQHERFAKLIDARSQKPPPSKEKPIVVVEDESASRAGPSQPNQTDNDGTADVVEDCSLPANAGSAAGSADVPNLQDTGQQVHGAVFGAFPSQPVSSREAIGNLASQRAPARTSLDDIIDLEDDLVSNDVHDVIASNGSDEDFDRAVWDSPLVSGKLGNSGGAQGRPLWTPVQHRHDNQQKQVSDVIEPVVSSSDEERRKQKKKMQKKRKGDARLLQASTDTDDSDDGFVVSDSGDDIIEEAPAPMDIDMHKMFLATISSQRTELPARGQGRVTRSTTTRDRAALTRKAKDTVARKPALTQDKIDDDDDDDDENAADVLTKSSRSRKSRMGNTSSGVSRGKRPAADRNLSAYDLHQEISDSEDEKEVEEQLKRRRTKAKVPTANGGRRRPCKRLTATKSEDVNDYDEGSVLSLFQAIPSADVDRLVSTATECLASASAVPDSVLADRLDKLRHHGDNPLHVAVRCGSVEAVKWMLGVGMDPSARSSADHLPVALCCQDSMCLNLVLQHLPQLPSSDSDAPTSAYPKRGGHTTVNLSADCSSGGVDACALLTHVLKWSHQLLPVVEGVEDTAACDLWFVDLAAASGTASNPADVFLLDARKVQPHATPAASSGAWCGCDALARLAAERSVQLVESAHDGLLLLERHGRLPKSSLADPSLVACACSSANAKCVKHLLENGASVAYHNKTDRTNCYHLAVLAEQSEIKGMSAFNSPESERARPQPDQAEAESQYGSVVAGDDVFGSDVPISVSDMYTDIQAALCIHSLHRHGATNLDAPDIEGFTPLMRACAAGRWHCAVALLLAGASIFKRDLRGVSPLHLAAAEGRLRCIQLLLRVDHAVDCVDDMLWPPLMYANFSADEQCVIELIKADPSQLRLLGALLERSYDSESLETRTREVICNILNALGNHDEYYRLFNAFISESLDVLEEDCFAFVAHCTGLLDFKNKKELLWRRLDLLRESGDGFGFGLASGTACVVERNDVLSSALDQLSTVPGRLLLNCFPDITFRNEPGICTGPRREFLTLLSREMVKDKHSLFQSCDKNNYMPSPGRIFETVQPINGGLRHYDRRSADRLRKFHLVGLLLASAVANQYQVDFSMAKPFVKKVLDRSLNHPHDLRHVDNHLHRSLVEDMMSSPVADVFDDMTFICPLTSPFDNQHMEFRLAKDGERVALTDQNKSSYVYRLSKFKLEDSIGEEVQCFAQGFRAVIPLHFLTAFTAAEFSLLMCGLSKIDIDDWKRNTHYTALHCDDVVVRWFWEVVEAMSDEERSLLLQFATSQARLPPGGFSELGGLGETSGFYIAKDYCFNKIPTASTCFNLLKLPDYPSKSALREKVLIAVRHGSEGFAYS